MNSASIPSPPIGPVDFAARCSSFRRFPPVTESRASDHGLDASVVARKENGGAPSEARDVGVECLRIRHAVEAIRLLDLDDVPDPGLVEVTTRLSAAPLGALLVATSFVR